MIAANLTRLLVPLALLGLASACTQVNANHCANREGDPSCAADSPDQPLCSSCVAANNGCVATIEEKDEAKCHFEGDTAAGTETVGGTETMTSPGTTATTPGTTMTTISSDSMSGGDTSTTTNDPTDSSADGSSSESSTGGGPVCGDGIIEGEERCDGDALDGESCTSLRLGAGELTCDPATCVFDTDACESQPSCMNDVIEGNEECSGTNLDEQSCTSLGYAVGELACDPVSCQFDEVACSYCGDGAITGTDECDGDDLGDNDCYDLGLDGGQLGCSASCTLDTSTCSPCGNGVLDANEQCDGGAFGGQDCVTAGYGMGTMGCTEHCLYDYSMCMPARGCGDDDLDEGEDCDGSVNGVTCADVAPIYGSSGGVLTCNDNCSFDVSGCCQGNLAACSSNADCCSGVCLLGGFLVGLVCVGD